MKADSFQVVELRKIKRGDYFMFHETGKVYVREEYNRETKKYGYSHFDDWNNYHETKGSRKVLTGFTF